MLLIASIKDDIIEKVSAVENDVTTTLMPLLTESPVTVPRDAPDTDEEKVTQRVSTVNWMMEYYKTTPAVVREITAHSLKTVAVTTKDAVKYVTVTGNGKPIKVTSRRVPPPKPQGAQNNSATLLPILCSGYIIALNLAALIIMH